ncbi:MAG TPA: trypsin-like peptidase domain-containing protein [Clostridiales bacterium]|nr:trypsin-like peptidase domain-containing protein [Clostridiales bacterium]
MFENNNRYNDYNKYNGRNRNNFSRTFLTSLITSLLVGTLLIVLIWGNVIPIVPKTGIPGPTPGQSPNLGGGAGVPNPQQIGVTLADDAPSVANVVKSAYAGVVGIAVLRADGKSIFDKNTTEKWGIGSGVIVNPNGYILTNHHVAGGKSKRLIVSFADGRNLDGVTLWSDPVLDLAVVKVSAAGLTAIPPGDATTLQIGEPAIAIGNPLGLELQRTVTSGIISALNRTISIETEQGVNYMEDLIQTDASINPGNSGGPLLNSRGQVVGINSIKVAKAEAIGFAIPINVAIPIINKFNDTGTFNEAYMGIFAYDKEAVPFLDQNIKLDNGIYVVEVDKSGPAAGAGIKEGCIIKQVDGVSISTMMELRALIYSKNPGDTINVTHIERSTGETVTVPIKLAAKEKDGLLTR